MQVIPHRYLEATAVLPMLHVPIRQASAASRRQKDGGTIVLVSGANAVPIASMVLRWPDVSSVMLYKSKGALAERRIEVVDNPNKKAHAILLTADQDPRPFLDFLADDGLLQTCTTIETQVKDLISSLKGSLGHATPWREYLPSPLFGVMASKRPIQRVRKPPAQCQRLSEKFLPNLFVFGADEVPLVFERNRGKL